MTWVRSSDWMAELGGERRRVTDAERRAARDRRKAAKAAKRRNR